MKFYLCNGQREKCGGSSVCRVPGGCFHTTDIFYALHDDPQNFEAVFHGREETDYWEVLEDVPRSNPKKKKR